ncbi:MAG: 6-phosphogluconolactonase [Phycisphaeraceae bacterium]
MTLNLPGTTHVHPVEDLFDELALALAAAASEAVKSRGVFHIALSGGSTPEPFYQSLVIDPRWRTIPWERTHLWIVDERCVPESHEKSNWKMIRAALTDHLPMKSRQLHPMPVMLPDAAAAYEEELTRVYESHEASAASRDVSSRIADQFAGSATPRLDFVLLGMGDDAHTASLFPGSPALNENAKLIASNDGPLVVPPPRVTMTYSLLNAARYLAVLCVGAKKLAMLTRVSEQMKTGGPDIANLPITGIAPTAGELAWYLTPAAAGAPSR